METDYETYSITYVCLPAGPDYRAGKLFKHKGASRIYRNRLKKKWMEVVRVISSCGAFYSMVMERSAFGEPVVIRFDPNCRWVPDLYPEASDFRRAGDENYRYCGSPLQHDALVQAQASLPGSKRQCSGRGEIPLQLVNYLWTGTNYFIYLR